MPAPSGSGNDDESDDGEDESSQPQNFFAGGERRYDLCYHLVDARTDSCFTAVYQLKGQQGAAIILLKISCERLLSTYPLLSVELYLMEYLKGWTSSSYCCPRRIEPLVSIRGGRTYSRLN